ncbi:uncharacterized mitochondrial protein-like protein [Tanacetum coccineum]
MVSSVANNPQSVMVSLLRVVSNALGLSKHLGHGNNQTTIDHIIKNLSRTFAVKDMGYLSYFLGIEITPKDSDLHLSQKKYILEILEKAGLSQAKPVKTPITTTTNLALGDSPLFEDPVRYRQIVGSLQYATLYCICRQQSLPVLALSNRKALVCCKMDSSVLGFDMQQSCGCC